ncbi:GNAT family N-acetyltransferase [Brevibacillus sp. SYSU BS000544]|uniref:GNAT family N-acetyltransferase n=1 Tax=Brevibacillus sp. SYSU BS000544 TaxID=3416443 RepID=UPI003CE5A865
MNTFPVLETNRFILRQLREEDSYNLFSYFSKDEVTKYYDLESFSEVSQATDLIHTWNSRFQQQQGIRWGITWKEEDRVIGTCGFHNWAKEHYKAEIGYELHPEFWQKGIMTEVITYILSYGFQELGLNRIEAFIDPANISSKKLLEKVGLREEGLLRECFYEKNRFVDALLFAIVKRDYNESQ